MRLVASAVTSLAGALSISSPGRVQLDDAIAGGVVDVHHHPAEALADGWGEDQPGAVMTSAKARNKGRLNAPSQSCRPGGDLRSGGAAARHGAVRSRVRVVAGDRPAGGRGGDLAPAQHRRQVHRQGRSRDAGADADGLPRPRARSWRRTRSGTSSPAACAARTTCPSCRRR